MNNMAPLRGLTEEEEKKWLPAVLGISATHPDFQKRVNDFWADLFIDVPSGGTVLQIGFQGDQPINLLNYIKYRWCLVHKHVAPDFETMNSSPLLKFYIYDPDVENKKTNKGVAVKRMAYAEFMKISGQNSNPDKMRRIIRLISTVNPTNFNGIELENLCDQLINENPEKFYRIAKDKDLDLKATIHELVDRGILRKIGNSYIYMDVTMGNTLDETVNWMRNTANSGVVAEIKAKFKESKRIQ